IGERLAIKLKTMINQFEAEFLGDLVLQFLDLIAGELDHLPGLNIDQMIVMLIRYFLVAGAAVTKIVALENTVFFQHADGAVNRRDADRVIQLRCPFVDKFHIRVILRFRQNARNNAALLGHPQALLDAKLFQASCRHVNPPITNVPSKIFSAGPSLYELYYTASESRDYLPAAFFRRVPRPIFLARLRRCSA